jgi:hypothetical protein
MGLVAFGASDAVSLARVPKRFTLIGNMLRNIDKIAKKGEKLPQNKALCQHMAKNI